MAINRDAILPRGQVFWDYLATPKALYIGDGSTALKNLTNLLDQSGWQDAIAALNATSLKISGAEDAQTIAQALAELQALATGAKMALVFDTAEQLDQWMEGTYTRPDGKVVADLLVGQNIFITAQDTPDYWWNGTDLIELEAKTNLADYLTATQTRDEIDTKITTALNGLPAWAKTGPPDDGRQYALRNGVWEKIVLDSDDLTA